MANPEDRTSLTQEDRDQLAPLVDIFLRSAAKKSASFYDLFAAAADHTIAGIRDFSYVNAGLLDAADLAAQSSKRSVREKAIRIYAAAATADHPPAEANAMKARATEALAFIIDREASRGLRFLAADELRKQCGGRLSASTKTKVIDAMLAEIGNPDRAVRSRAILPLLDPGFANRAVIGAERAGAIAEKLNQALARETDGSVRLAIERARVRIQAIDGHTPAPAV